MNRNWKDKISKTLFKSIFCILSTELVYNLNKKCTSLSKVNISIHFKQNCTQTLGRAQKLIHEHIRERDRQRQRHRHRQTPRQRKGQRQDRREGQIQKKRGGGEKKKKETARARESVVLQSKRRTPF